MKSKVVWLVIGLAAIAIGIGVYFAYKTGLFSPSAETGPVTMALSPSSGNYKVGQTFDVGITVNMGTASTVGVQANLTYDPAVLEVQDADPAMAGVQITPGTVSDNVPGNLALPDTGKIGIAVVLMPPKTFTGSGTVGTIKFKALKVATSTKLAYTFTAGSKTGTVVTGPTSENILTSVTDGAYVIQEASTTPTIDLTSNKATLNSGEEATLSWTITGDFSACTATPAGWFTASATGTKAVKPTTTTTYKITCGTVTDQVVVTVGAPTASIKLTANGTADAITVDAGDSVALAWTSTGSPTSCVATPAGWYTATTTGSKTVTVDSTTTYKIACSNSVSDQVVVTVAGDEEEACTAPLTETRTQTCPTGQTGSITQSRTKGSAPSCTWGSWTTTSNTCTATVVDSAPVTTAPAATGPETPFMAGGALSVLGGAYYLIKRRLG